jgi:putative redox protein
MHEIACRSTEGYRVEVRATGGHVIYTDERKRLGGDDSAMSPMQLLAASLGACKVVTLLGVAQAYGLPVTGVEAHVSRRGELHLTSPADHNQRRNFIGRLDLEIIVHGKLTSEEKLKLHEGVDACPVENTLRRPTPIDTTVIYPDDTPT